MIKNTKASLNFSTNAQNSFQHWMRQRVTAILMLPSFILVIYWFQGTLSNVTFDAYNLTSLFAMISTMWNERTFFVQLYLIIFFFILIVHIGEGIDSIIQDYVHNENTKTLSSIFLRCVQILLVKHVYLLLFI